jgi:hypothetical protein
MNLMFHDMINHTMEVYIDDIVIKSKSKSTHLDQLYALFEWMRMYDQKMNLLKYAFGV